MRKDFGVKPYLFPQPVLIIGTYDQDGNANAMNAAWGGVADDDEIMICLSNHKTTENLKINKACTISIGDVKNVIPCDFVGMTSGNQIQDKTKKAGWTTSKSKFVNAPIINELPVALECTLSKIIDDCKYLFKIVNVSIDEDALSNGEIDYAKFHPITYDIAHHGYYALGEKVGQAFSSGKAIK